MSDTIHLEISGGRTVEITSEIAQLVRDNAPAWVGVSGGKDSAAVAFATQEVLELLGHMGPRGLIHADLGLVEWTDSLPTCRRLAEHMGWELMVVERESGGMMERWEQRWEDNWNRYRQLLTVKTILPWSNARFRFCSGELKVQPISISLSKRYGYDANRSTLPADGVIPEVQILSITGIRREEGSKNRSEGGRAHAPTARPEPKLNCASRGTSGFQWNPIAHWSEEYVWSYIAEKGFVGHEAYRRFGSRRVSCVVCIFSRPSDMLAALSDPRNHPAYFRMVDLENLSTFSFQEKLWLSDVRPEILTPAQIGAAHEAKRRAERRIQAEARIPKHLEYTRGWPTRMPDYSEAALLAEVRLAVADAIGRTVLCTTPDTVLAEYEHLMDKARAKGRLPNRDRLAVAQGSLF